jgi:hypothetical protein
MEATATPTFLDTAPTAPVAAAPAADVGLVSAAHDRKKAILPSAAKPMKELTSEQSVTESKK